jgi:hypothetical protein
MLQYKISDMNLELQGNNKCIAEMMSTVSSYKSKFELMMTDLQTILLITFLISRAIWKNILISFFRQRNRFCDFQGIRGVVEYLSFPFKS